MTRARSWLTVAAAALLWVGCTRTIYVVQNADGSFVEIDEGDPGDEDLDAAHDEVLEVAFLASNDYVLSDGDGTVYVAVELHALDVAPVERAPMNVALVIDRSGSMQGDKLEAARAAAVSLVGELADGDRVALLSYASDVSVEVPMVVLGPGSRARLEEAIVALEAGGGTALADALDAGAREVLRGRPEDGLDRVLLLSDGRPTVGETDSAHLETVAARLYEEGVSVTTLGIGYDYNEDLMTGVAVAGGGNYYFVEHAREMAGVLGRELRSFGRTVARDVELTLALPPGVRVRDVYGYRHEARDGGVLVRLSSLGAGERRRLLVALDVPSGRDGTMTLASGHLGYLAQAGQRRREVVLAPIRVTYTDDPQRVARGGHRAVVEKVEAVRNAELRRDVVEHLDRGERGAAEVLVERRLDETRRAKAAVGGAALAREVDDLEGFAGAVRAAPAPSSDRYRAMRKVEKARAYDAMMR